jgi:hypothetical protein
MEGSKPGFFDRVSRTYKRAVGAAAAAGAAGAAAWWLPTGVLQPPSLSSVPGFLATAKDKFLQHQHLVNELGEAQRYIHAVEKWMSATATKFCQDNLRRILADVKGNVSALLHQSSGHFISGIEKYDAELAAVIRRGQEALDGDRDSYLRWINNLYQWATNYWWSDYYRADLSAHMIKLIEAVESGVMAIMVNDITCPPMPVTSQVQLNPMVQHDFDMLLKKIEERGSVASDESYLSTPVADEDEEYQPRATMSPPKLRRQLKKRVRATTAPDIQPFTFPSFTPPTTLGGVKRRRQRTPSSRKSSRKSVSKGRRRNSQPRKSRK